MLRTSRYKHIIAELRSFNEKERVDIYTAIALNGFLAKQVIVIDQVHHQSHFTHKSIPLSRKLVATESPGGLSLIPFLAMSYLLLPKIIRHCLLLPLPQGGTAPSFPGSCSLRSSSRLARPMLLFRCSELSLRP